MEIQTTPRIAVISYGEDLHALAVAARITEMRDATCVVVPADFIASAGYTNWTLEKGSGLLPTAQGGAVEVRDLDLVWWRRLGRRQSPSRVGDLSSAEADLVNNDCRFSLLGILLTDFTGSWVCHPVAT